MDAEARRLRDIDQSLLDVCRAFSLAFVFGWLPVVGILVCGYLAMGLKDLGRHVTGEARWSLRVAAAAGVGFSAAVTADLWVDGTWLRAVAALLMGSGIGLATVGLGELATQFGASRRWKPARIGGVLSACAGCLAAGLLFAGPDWNRGPNAVPVAHHTAGIVGMVVLVVSLFFVARATSQLYDRVSAASSAAARPVEIVSG